MAKNGELIDFTETVKILGKDRVVTREQSIKLFGGEERGDTTPGYSRSILTKCKEENEAETADWYLISTLGMTPYEIKTSGGELSKEFPQLKVDYPYSKLIINCAWERINHPSGIFLLNGMNQLESKHKSYIQQNREIKEIDGQCSRIPPVLLVEFALVIKHLFEKDILDSIIITDSKLHYGNNIAMSTNKDGKVQVGNIHMCALTDTRLMLNPIQSVQG